MCVCSSSNENGSVLEKEALLSAIGNTTLPRLIAKDVPTVRLILWDLFHMTESENKDESYTKLNVINDYIGINGRTHNTMSCFLTGIHWISCCAQLLGILSQSNPKVSRTLQHLTGAPWGDVTGSHWRGEVLGHQAASKCTQQVL